MILPIEFSCRPSSRKHTDDVHQRQPCCWGRSIRCKLLKKIYVCDYKTNIVLNKLKYFMKLFSLSVHLISEASVKSDVQCAAAKLNMYCGAMFNIDIWDSAQGRLTVVHYYTACGGALADPVRGSPMFGHTWWLPMLIKLAFIYVVRFSHGRESAKSSFICLDF